MTAPKEHGPIVLELVRPAPQISADGISCADGRKHYEVARFKCPDSRASRVASGIVAAVVLP